MVRNSLMLLVLSIVLVQCRGIRPDDLGVKDGKLKPCPGPPNCVNSQAVDERHAIQGFSYTGSPDSARTKLLNLLSNTKDVAIISVKDDYVYTEFSTRLLRYVDDVEFYINDQEKIIHVRSASRLGYSDLGANRKRIENLRALWKQ